jgi:hypothetical protein
LIPIVASIVESLITPVTGLISEFITDKDKQAEIAFKISVLASEQAHSEVLAQVETNKIEAASSSLFVAGWRPAVGWICAAGMGINFIITPLLSPVLNAYTRIGIPQLDMTQMMPVLIGMLGLAAARSIDKKNGVA